MSEHLKDSTVLSNGVKMPWLGLGVWRVNEGQQVEDSVKHAISTGYVSIDTAAIYGNEEGVGRAIQDSGVARDNLFVTTKVWNADQGYDTTLKAFEESRRSSVLIILICTSFTGRYKANTRTPGVRLRSCTRTAWCARLASATSMFTIWKTFRMAAK